MRILILGGDGYLGWPTALHLSARDHEIAVVDNLVRREYDDELGTSSLVPISDLDRRTHVWEQLTGRTIVAAGARVPSLFAPSTVPTLTLITCTGVWDKARGTDTQRLLVSAALE